MTLLAGDIGGTKTLLAIYEWDKVLTQKYQKKYISKDWTSFLLIIQDFFKGLPKDINLPSYGCIGVAGIISNNSCSLTNLDWEIDSNEICKLTNLNSFELINDFSVLIYGLKYFQETQYISIQGKNNINSSLEDKFVSIVGAGTGLGIASGLITPNKIQVLPSEGGHSEFSPRTTEEWELANWLKEDLNLARLSIERVVSGTGLGHIARWMLMRSSAKLHPLRPLAEDFHSQNSNKVDMPAIVSDAAKKGDGLMLDAMNLWLSAYGSLAGDIALQNLCYTGLWIGGGSSQKNIEGIKSVTFLDSFKKKGRFTNFLESLPVMALIDPEAGLFSAACRAHLLSIEMGDLSE